MYYFGNKCIEKWWCHSPSNRHSLWYCSIGSVYRGCQKALWNKGKAFWKTNCYFCWECGRSQQASKLNIFCALFSKRWDCGSASLIHIQCCYDFVVLLQMGENYCGQEFSLKTSTWCSDFGIWKNSSPKRRPEPFHLPCWDTYTRPCICKGTGQVLWWSTGIDKC